MTPLRLGLATIAAALLSLSLAAASLGARAHTSSSRSHHAPRCGRTRRPHGRAGSFHARHRASRPRRLRCAPSRARRPRRHLARSHAHRRARHLGPSGSHRPRSAAVDGICPDAQLRPSEQNLELIRGAVLCLVNRERTTRGESPLRQSTSLERAAQAHTESMVFGDYFDHIGPGGQTPLERMRAAGYIYSSNIGYEVGENIAWGSGSLSTPAAIVAAWMASPGHRANILDGGYRDSAVGVSPNLPRSLRAGSTGGIYTQDFGVISTA